MRRFVLIAACGLAALLHGSAAAAEPGAETLTAKGEVVDLACYMERGDKGRGPTHLDCADQCVRGGAPIGLLGSDGSVLLLVENHGKPAPYAQLKKLGGKNAEVEGVKFNRGGIAALQVNSVKEE